MTPDQLPGTCKLLLKCQTLLTLYASDKSITSVRYIIGTQTACGNRAVGSVPYICCRDGFPNVSVRPIEESTTKAPHYNLQHSPLMPTIQAKPQKLESSTHKMPDIGIRGPDLFLELLPPYEDKTENCYTPDEVAGSCMSKFLTNFYDM